MTPVTKANQTIFTFGGPQATGSRQSVLAREMLAQPKSLADTLNGQRGAVTEFAKYLQKHGTTLVDVVAIGSSRNAANIGRFAMPSGISLNVQEPPDYIPTSKVVVFVSQSGASSDAVPVFDRLKSMKRQRPLIVTLTNTLDSPFAAGADIVLPTYAMKEEAIAATGTMISAAATFMHLGVELAIAKDSIMSMPGLAIAKDGIMSMELMGGLPASVGNYFGSLGRSTLGEVVESLKDVVLIAFLGERIFRGVADECALKVQETAEVITISNGTRMFRHGYNAPFGARVPPVSKLKKGIFVFLSGDETENKIVANYAAHADKKGYQFHSIGYGKWSQSLNYSQFVRNFCVIPMTGSLYQSWEPAKALLSIVEGQVLAHDLAVAKGLEPGTSEILSKVVVDNPGN